MVKSKKQDSLYGYVVHRQEQEQSLALLENKIVQEMILEHLHKGSLQYGRCFVDIPIMHEPSSLVKYSMFEIWALRKKSRQVMWGLCYHIYT